MAQQKSEDRIVPEGGVMPAPTRRVEHYPAFRYYAKSQCLTLGDLLGSERAR